MKRRSPFLIVAAVVAGAFAVSAIASASMPADPAVSVAAEPPAKPAEGEEPPKPSDLRDECLVAHDNPYAGPDGVQYRTAEAVDMLNVMHASRMNALEDIDFRSLPEDRRRSLGYPDHHVFLVLREDAESCLVNAETIRDEYLLTEWIVLSGPKKEWRYFMIDEEFE